MNSISSPAHRRELGTLVAVQSLGLAPQHPVALDPVAQGPGVDPQVFGHTGDRLAGLVDDPNSPIPELPVVLSSRVLA